MGTTIHTARLIVRLFRDQDAGDLYEYLSRPEIYRFESGEPVSRAKAAEIAADFASGTNFWAAELSDAHKVVGHISLFPSGPDRVQTWEIGYIFNPDYQRHGYATEAARAVIGYTFRELDACRIVAHCSPLNTASWKVLEKCGLRREGLQKRNIFFHYDAAGKPEWFDSYDYAILADEFAAAEGQS
jgi:ribosomal-protein-alanine N-acetyltransferase